MDSSQVQRIISLAILAVAAVLVPIFVSQRGISLILAQLSGDRVFQGEIFSKSEWLDGMKAVHDAKKRREFIDSESLNAYRQSGTIFTVQPDVRLDVVDLNVTQELSSFVATTTGVNNSPTMLQRTATSQLSIKPGEVIVFAGLEEHRDDQNESRFFGWSVGEKSSNASTEVLLFIEAQVI